MIHSASTITTLEIVPLVGRTVVYPGDEVRLRWTLDRHPAQNTTVELIPSLAGVLINLPPVRVVRRIRSGPNRGPTPGHRNGRPLRALVFAPDSSHG